MITTPAVSAPKANLLIRWPHSIPITPPQSRWAGESFATRQDRAGIRQIPTAALTREKI